MEVPIRNGKRLNPQDLKYHLQYNENEQTIISWKSRPTDFVVEIPFSEFVNNIDLCTWLKNEFADLIGCEEIINLIIIEFAVWRLNPKTVSKFKYNELLKTYPGVTKVNYNLQKYQVTNEYKELSEHSQVKEFMLENKFHCSNID